MVNGEKDELANVKWEDSKGEMWTRTCADSDSDRFHTGYEWVNKSMETVIKARFSLAELTVTRLAETRARQHGPWNRSPVNSGRQLG